MTKYQEILRLKSLNLSQQNIANSCNVSKKTVNRVLKQATELGISWPPDENDTDAVLAEKLFPSAKQVTSCKKMPGYVLVLIASAFFGITAPLKLREKGGMPLKVIYCCNG